MPSTAKPEVSAALFKELLVEWTLRNWESGLVNDLSATNLTKMSIFDAENFDSTNVNTPAYPALDLYSALTRAVSDIDRESYLIQRLAPLMQPENTELRQEVERLLDVELIGYSKVKQEKLNLRSKATLIAGRRLKKDIEFQETPTDYSDNPKKYEFKVFLTTLVGGHGGSTKFSNKPLFFNYATQYHYFMKILQDETQLSTIPPLDLEKSRYITPEALKQRLTQHEESRDSIERGYTVLDGPWLYRIRKSNQVQKATYQKVGDEASYHRMLDTLNEANKKDPTTESALVLVHAMDKTVMEQWDEKARQEEKYEEERKESFKSMLWGDGTEEDIGEPYLAWMRRNSNAPSGQ